ncbi:MAG: quinone oxidoreductase [Alphaproteobacteria bacterium]|nr:quinone oxidoreductase [Alphaproteobacteria bacterium]
MVKAIRMHSFGGPKVLKWEGVEVGEPGPGQIRLRHTAVDFNFLNVLTREGKYPVLPQLPAVPGLEAAGVIEAVGPGVAGFKVGDRVAYAGGAHGACAEARVMATDQVVQVPADVTDEQAAAVLLKGMTVEYLIHRTYPAKAGEYALVHAAAGGVGLLLCQWLATKGAVVIAATSSAAKNDEARANGATHAVNYREAGWGKTVRAMTGGAGLHVVYDSVGPDVWQESIDALRLRGYYVNYGNASGPLKPIDAGELNVKGSLFFTKASMRFYNGTRPELEASAAATFDMVAKGRPKPHIGQRFALKDVAKAQVAVAGRTTTGATVFTV